MLIHASRRLHAELVVPTLGAPTGMSEVEVARLQSSLGLRLPAAYREYLLWMGDDRHGIFRGSEWFGTDVTRNRRALLDMFAEAGSSWQLADSDLVFFSHQEYMAAWFDTATGEDDPRCLFYREDLAEPRRDGRFSEFLLEELTHLAGFLPPSPKPKGWRLS